MHFFIFICCLTAFVPLMGHELVDIRHINSRIQVAYPGQKALAVKEVATRLSRVQQELEKDCIGLVIRSAYYPCPFDIPAGNPVCDEGDFHDRWGNYRGTGVDVTMVYLSGCPLEMESADERLTSNVYHNRYKLEQAMMRQGFVPSPNNWWHFDFKYWRNYPLITDSQ